LGTDSRLGAAQVAMKLHSLATGEGAARAMSHGHR
jgi:hypothetical protein